MTTFSTSRQLAAPPRTVFAAIENPDCLARWWGPDGFSNTFATFDFRPGGRWTFTMHGPDGSNYPNDAEFMEIIPAQLVRIRHTSQPNFELKLELQARDGGTFLKWQQVFADEAVAQAIRHIVEPANEQNLNRLAEELAKA